MGLSNLILVYQNSIHQYSIRKSGKKYSLVSVKKLESLENIKNVRFVAFWDDEIQIRKVETPKTKNRKLIWSLIKRDLSDIDNIDSFIIRYKVSKESDLNKEYNVYLYEKEKFYKVVSAENQETIRVYTSIPFCLAFFNRELGQKKVLHIYIEENRFVALYTVNSSVEFVRVINLDTDLDAVQQIYENVVLTHKYITLNISQPDIVMFSGNIFLTSFTIDSISDSIKQGLSVLNYKYYIDDKSIKLSGYGEDEVKHTFEFILLIGLLNLDSDYNFLPESIKAIYRENLTYKLSVYTALFFNILLVLKVYDAAVSFVDNWEKLYKKSKEINILNQYIKDISERKNIDLLYSYFLNQKEKEKQIENLRKLVEIQPFVGESSSKLIYNYNKPVLNFEYSKEFKTYKELDSYIEMLKNKKGITVNKGSKPKSINVSITID